MTTTGILPGVGPAGPLAKTRSGPSSHSQAGIRAQPPEDGWRLASRLHIQTEYEVKWYFCAVHIKERCLYSVQAEYV